MTLACLTDFLFYAFLLKDIGKRGNRWWRRYFPHDVNCCAVWESVNPSDWDSYPNIPVDLVYTWVDGTDPAHIRMRKHWAAQLGVDTADAMSPQRFVSHKELKLSLRSVDKFLPWIRYVFIVTNGQVPDWLDTSHPKIRMVTHEQLFPDMACLPTFNSHAIEFQLHRIPGLSEHFIYCNDDNFFGSPCTKADFFSFPQSDVKSGIMHAQYDDDTYILPAYLYGFSRLRKKWHWKRAWNNLKVLLEQDFPSYRVRRNFIHQATPLKKTFFEKAVAYYPELYMAVSASRFRSGRDVPPIGLVQSLAMIEGKAVLKPIPHRYLRALEDLREYLANDYPAKLCCVNLLRDEKDICDAIMDLGYCTEPSSFEKKISSLDADTCFQAIRK